ncbi:MAG: hypothetical protein ABIO70_14390 [Pseudomonadota bacterium]
MSRGPPLRPLLALPALFLAGCAALHRLLPEGPVLSQRELAAFPATPAPSGVNYTGAPAVPFPVLPVQLWGLHYAIDLVLVSDHPDWTMHEYARLDLPTGTLWLAKDADRDGDQHVTADLPDIATWLPEIPVPRTAAELKADDHSTPERVDLHLSSLTPNGEPVALTYEGRRPQHPPGKRNGSTMEHSRRAVAAVLDLAGMRHGGKVSLSIGGQQRGIQRLFGLYPMKFVLDQVQAGFAVASFRQEAATGGFALIRPAPGVDWPTRGEETWVDDGATVRRDGEIVTLVYHMAPATGDARELRGGQVWQAAHDQPLLTLRLDRALPDLARPFEGRATSRFVLDVHGQPAHGTGTLSAWWEEAGPVVELRPEAPWWLAERPMRTEVRYQAGGAVVSIARIAEKQGRTRTRR